MQVDFKTNELDPCQCGFKPTHYTVGYGSTPYDIFCPDCKKQTTFAKCKITGRVANLIDYWNKVISKMTVEQIEDEYTAYIKEKNEPENLEYKIYDYYWFEGEGEKLIKR